jgi:hypothetical protein
MAGLDLEARPARPGSPRRRPRGPAVSGGPGRGRAVLPRKEVIQPHVPVRLPCYDFTLITDPTLVAYRPRPGGRGLARRLRVLPAFMV